MQHHGPSRHSLHVNISRSASTEITTLCVLCVCGALICSLLANYSGFLSLHNIQSKKTPCINIENMVTRSICLVSKSFLYFIHTPTPAGTSQQTESTSFLLLTGLSFILYFVISHSMAQTAKLSCHCSVQI